MPPELANVRSWLIKADHDRRTAVAALAQAPPVTDTAAFHCQQAVEKLLKAYLVYHRMWFEKIHDLEALLAQCITRDASFAELYDRVEPLSAYAVRFRYSGPDDPTVEQARSALAVVEQVREFVGARLPPETLP